MPSIRLFQYLLVVVVAAAGTVPCYAQRHRWQDEGFVYRRLVELPAGMETPPAIIVTDFFTHGARPNGTGEVAVYAHQDLVSAQVLQSGPGDLCRVAFQVAERESRYFIYYGGRATEPKTVAEWTPQVGLLFETREWRPCNLADFTAVHDAFHGSTRIGADLVGEVFHRHNPFAAEPNPFLSRYVGTLDIVTPGRYSFFTSSQDCSFLLIDGQKVVAAPGTHPPVSHAKLKGDIQLDKGPHRFEYYHAAVGAECCMVAAWQMPGFDKPVQMSPDLFRFRRMLRLAPSTLEHREQGFVPDFRVAVIGDIPFADDHPAMVRTQFIDASLKTIATNAKYTWSFGDGQTSELANPGHVYLHPGPYRIALSLQHGSKNLEVVNQVVVTRQFAVDPQGQQSENMQEYLAALEQYNASQLDVVGLVQLVRTYLLTDNPGPAAVAAQAALTSSASEHTDESRWTLVQLVGPVLRGQLDSPQAAAKLWRDASQWIRRGEWQAACAIEAADIHLNDLLQPTEAEKLLAFAEPRLSDVTPLIRSRYQRILGDWYARTGKGKEAHNAYSRAQAKRELPQNISEQNAWRGAHSRSAEAFLHAHELARARTELDQWLQDFPSDKIDGYWSLLQMRYWIAREKAALALAVASDALTVNPNSPYADRLLFLSAQCEESRGQFGRATATLQALLSDYPGSPLVDQAKTELVRLNAPRAPTPAAGGQPDRTVPAKSTTVPSPTKLPENKK